MYYFLIAIHVIASILLIVIVLLQAGRGGGLSGAFGMGDNQTLFGNRASDFLTKSTTVVAVLFMAGSLLLAIVSVNRSRSIMQNVKIEDQGVPGAFSTPEDSQDDISDISIPLGDDQILQTEGVEFADDINVSDVEKKDEETLGVNSDEAFPLFQQEDE